MKKNLLPAIGGLLFLMMNTVGAQAQVMDNFLDKIVAKEAESHRSIAEASRLNAGPITVASANFTVNYFRCEWEIDPAVRQIAGKVTSYFNITNSTNKIVFDLSDTLRVDSILYHTQKISFNRLANDGLEIQFPAVINANTIDSVSIFYRGVPRIGNGLRAFQKSTHGAANVIWTLSEPYGSKEWWPCRNGLDDKIDSIDIIITNPATQQAASNGTMWKETTAAGKKTSYWKHRYPVASYLVALAVSNYSVLKDTVKIGNKVVNLVDYAYPENADVFTVQTTYTKYTLNLFSKLFGEYPFANEKYGHTQFNFGGGMEHQTNSFIQWPHASLIIHELGHQWFGDRITCGSWQDLWLNEGFTTYLQLLFNESYDVIYLRQTLGAYGDYITAQPGGSVWVDDTSNVDRLFSDRLTYYKGCYVVHMLRWKLGDSAFFRGVRNYINDPNINFKFARTNDLKRHLEQESGKDLTNFFQQWFYGQGHPTYTVNWSQDTNHVALVNINQVTSHPSVSFYQMPVALQFKNSTRDTIIVLDNTKNNEYFLCNPGFKADTILFDPHFNVLSRSNKTVKQSCETVTNTDNLLPTYTVNWSQNLNNWLEIDISQTNTSASALAENIPVQVHFSGNGKDSIITLQNIRYAKHLSVALNYKVTNVYAVSSSCLVKGTAVAISNKTVNNNPNTISIFPVPVYTQNITVNIKNPTGTILDVRLLNLQGQLMYRKSFNLLGQDLSFQVPVNISRGVYILQLRDEKGLKLSRKITRM